MAKDKVTQPAEEVQEESKQRKGAKVDKSEIVKQISQLPLKERMDLIRDLQQVATNDADAFSVGGEGTSSHYDTLRDEYQKKAKEAEEKQPQETK